MRFGKFRIKDTRVTRGTARLEQQQQQQLQQQHQNDASVKRKIPETISDERNKGKETVGFSCIVCSRVFARRANLTKHLKNCQENGNRTRMRLDDEDDGAISSETVLDVSQRLDIYQCTHCDFTASKKKLLNLHTSEHHHEKMLTSEIKKERQLQPSVNERDFVSRARMEANGRVYYHCGDCGKNLFSPYTFAGHMRIHSGERFYTCHLCGKQFRVRQGLARHIRETHEGIKKFACNLCGRMFSTKRNVDDHERIHTNERPFVCTSCGKAFKQKASLFVHNRTHTNVFPFKCIYCNQAFRTRPPLVLHMTKHTGEKPHTCDICGRAFRIKHELKRHRLIHSDEKPWQCQDCELSFRQKRYLVNHRRINHGREDKNNE